MKANVFRKLLIGGFAAGVLFLSLYVVRTPASIQTHRRFVQDSRSWYKEPTTLRGHLSLRYVRWILAGKPDIARQMALGREHEEILVRMGYFRRRTYVFTNDNRADFVRTIRARPLKDPLLFFRFDTNASVEVLAQRDDFPEIERVLEKFGGHK